MGFTPNKLLLNLLVVGLMFSSYLYAEFNLLPRTRQKKSNPNELQTQKELPKQNQDSTLTWKPFTSTEAGFTATFPTVPQHLEQKITIPRTDISIDYHTFISEPSDKSVYVISVWNYPATIDMSKPEVNLQDGFKGMLSALPGSEVQNMQMSETQGFKTLDFLVKNEDIYFQGKLILVYNTLYQIFAVYKDVNGSTSQVPNTYTRFINSFKLINPEKRKVFQEKINPEKGIPQPNSKTKVTL